MSEKFEPIVEKYKIWDVVNQKWFRPTYPGPKKDNQGKIVNVKITEEILFSQSGEMYLRKNTGEDKNISASIIDCDQLEHVSKDLYIPCLYSGWKDLEGNKWYEGDICRCEYKTSFIVTFSEGAFRERYIGSPTPPSIFPVIDKETVRLYTKVGNVLETPELLK